MLIQQTAFSYFDWRRDPQYQVVTRPEDLQEMVKFLAARKRFAFDSETSGLQWWRPQVQACGYSFSGRDAVDGRMRNYYVPIRHFTGQAQLDPDLVISAIKPLMESEDQEKIAHHLKFDEHFLHREGILIKGPRHDTMVAAHLFDENRRKGLKYRAFEDLGDPDAHFHDELLSTEVARLGTAAGLGKKEYLDRYGYAGMDIWVCGAYAGHDTAMTLGLHEHYERLGLHAKYAEVYGAEMALTEALCDMEEVGVQLDVEYLQKLHERLIREKEAAEGRFFTAAKVEYFNLGSDDELRHYLQRGLKLPLTKTTKKGDQLSVDLEVLHNFVPVRPHLQHLVRWRDCDKKTSTYTTALIERADENGVLHCDLKADGTNTGRLSCLAPNLQNIPSDSPKRSKEAPDGVDPESIKRAFIVPRQNLGTFREWEGRRLVRVAGDYSQVELRVLAWYTKDERLMRTFQEDGDIHDEVENAVFGTGKKTAEGDVNRRKAKIINFGLTYGMSPIGFMHQIEGVSQDEAEYYFNEYSRKFPGVERFKQQFWAYIRQNEKQFENSFGRTRRMPNISAHDNRMRGRAERQAFATLIQGTAAELMKRLIVRAYRRFKQEGLSTRCVLTIHDELQTDGPAEEFAIVTRLTKELAEDFGDYMDPVPLKFEFKATTKSWAQMKAIQV